MAKKTDAFGREIDEDPLAGLRATPGPGPSDEPRADPWGRGGEGTSGGASRSGASSSTSGTASWSGSGQSAFGTTDAQAAIPDSVRAMLRESLGTDDPEEIRRRAEAGTLPPVTTSVNLDQVPAAFRPMVERAMGAVDPAEMQRRAAMAAAGGTTTTAAPGARGLRCIIGLVVLSIVVSVAVGVGGAVISAFDATKDASDAVRRIGDGFSSSTSSGSGSSGSRSTEAGSTGAGASTQGASASADPPVGLARGSMLRPGEFGRALTHLRAAGGRSRSLSIRPDRINATLRLNDGRSRNVSIDWQGARRVITTSGTSSPVGLTSLKGVESRAPSRAVNGAARLLGRPVSRVDYVVLSTAGSLGTRWLVFFEGGGSPVFTDASGRNASRTPS
ncbi:MAG: hypothetical protein AB7G37_02425 [Solirubrobacteraceae bacterium]